LQHFEPRSRARRADSPFVLLASVVLLVLAALFLTLVVLQQLGGLRGPRLDPDAEPRAVTARGDLAQDERSTIELFRLASPSVVHINTSRLQLARTRFSTDVHELPEGSGSGFLWDREGHVVTNFHVIRGADRAQVTLADQTTWDARLVGEDPNTDLAVLEIDAPGERLQPLPLGTSADLQVGQSVFAVGNPFGLDQTLTTGVISGLGREIRSVTGRVIADVIQTDAVINPGNSGGPLLDSAGRLVGVNTTILTRTGTWSGVGFAVPVDTVNRIVPQLLRHGRIVRPVIGVQVVADSWARAFGIDGVIVSAVVPGGPAQAAGIEPAHFDRSGELRLGDVIVALDGLEIGRQDDLFAQLEARRPGDRVELTLENAGRRRTVGVTLESGDADGG